MKLTSSSLRAIIAEEGAAGGGSTLGSGDTYALLLDLLDGGS